MKNKRNLMFGMLFLFSIMALTFASATVTISTPSANSILIGSSNAWNVSGTVNFINITSCQIWGSSSSTANSTALNLSQAQNGTLNAVYVYGNLNLSTLRGIEDSNDYSIYAVCTNSSAGALLQQNSSAVTITIDNGVPTAPTSLSPSSNSQDSDGIINFSATVTGTATTGCTLLFNGRNPGSATYTMTHGGNLCYYSFDSSTSKIPEETYNYTIRASDGSNTTDSVGTSFSVLLTKTGGNYLFNNPAASRESTSKALAIGNVPGIGISWWWVIGIVAIVVIITIAKKK